MPVGARRARARRRRRCRTSTARGARFDSPAPSRSPSRVVALVLAVTWVARIRTAAQRAACSSRSSLSVVFVVFFVIELRVRRADRPAAAASRTGRSPSASSCRRSSASACSRSPPTCPTYFQMAYRTTATVSGLVPIATVFGMLVSNLLTGWLASRTGRYRPFPIVGTALAAAGLLDMALLPPGLPLWVPMVVMAVVGIGTGAFMNLIVAVVQSAAPRSDIGSVTATINLVRQVGSTIATAVIGGVIGARRRGAACPRRSTPQRSPRRLVHACDRGRADCRSPSSTATCCRPIFLGLAIVYAVGIVAALLLPGGRLSDELDPDPYRPSSRPSPDPDARPRRGDVMSTTDPTRRRSSAAARSARRTPACCSSRLPDGARRHVRGRPAAHRGPGRERAQHRRPRREGAGARDVAGSAGRARFASRSGIPAGVVVEGMFTARQGTHLLDFGGEGSAHAPTFPAARGLDQRRRAWVRTGPARRRARRSARRSRSSTTPSGTSCIAAAEGSAARAERGVRRLGGRRRASARCSRRSSAPSCPRATAPSTLPVAGDPQPDGTMRWAGADVVLGPLIDPASPLSAALRAARPVAGAPRRASTTGGPPASRSRTCARARRRFVPADLVVVAADAFRSPQLLWASGIRPAALGHYLTEHPVVISTVALDAERMAAFATEEDLDAELARRALNPADPVAAVNRIPFSEPDHPFSLQVMYAENPPFPLDPAHPARRQPLGLRQHGLRHAQAPARRGRRHVRRRRARLPRLPEHDHRVRADRRRARRDRRGAPRICAGPAQALGTFIAEPRLLPNGSSLHYMGTMRMGDDRRRHLGRRPVVARVGLRRTSSSAATR